jgi:hypothetical protein
VNENPPRAKPTMPTMMRSIPMMVAGFIFGPFELQRLLEPQYDAGVKGGAFSSYCSAPAPAIRRDL